MSAFNLFSSRPLSEATAPAATPAIPAEPSRGDETGRSFRETLSDTEPDRITPTRAEADSTRSETAVEADADDRQAPPDTEAIDSPAADDQTRGEDAGLTDVASNTDAAGSTVAESVDGQVIDEQPAATELVLDLITAFEAVLENNPLAQAISEAVTDHSDAGSALPGLDALYETLAAVSAATGGNTREGTTNTSPSVATTNAASVVAPPTSPTNSAGNAATPTVSPDLASAQAQANGDAAGNPNQNSDQRSGEANNPSLQTGSSAALAGGSAATAGPPLPGFEAVANNTATAAQPSSPLVNATSASTDVTARLNPAGLTDPNATNDTLNSARLTRGLNSAVSQQGGAVTLRLTPPDLGTVRIQLNLQGTNVTAQFHAETDSAQRLLTQQLGQLRTSLESQGLNVEKLGVQAMSASSNSSSLQQQTGGDNAPSQNQANADGRSRGQFGQSSQQNNQGRDGNADGNAPESAPASFTQLLTPDAAPGAKTASAVLDSLTGAA